MSSLQCTKKVHLEVHRKDLIQYSARTQAAFQLGHDIGDLAIEIYGKGQGEFIPYEGGLKRAEERSRELMDGLLKAPVFEATLTHQDVLVREDVLLPNGNSWDIIEVKAATSLKDQYVADCAVQAWVHRGAGYDYQTISLAHVDNQFVYGGDGSYEGLLTTVDLTDTVNDLQSSVPVWVERAKQAVDGPEPEVAVGQHCFSPYECPFVSYCWPTNTEFPVLGLGGAKKKLGELIAQGFDDVRNVPADRLSSEGHLRIHRVAMSGTAEILPGAGEFMRDLSYPRYHFDFETVGPAIPVWEGTRPYEALPFQWSCHVEHEDGLIDHLEFLDLSGEPPMRSCAEQMIRDFGNEGPILVYTSYEKGVIKKLIERFPDLEGGLQAILERLVDIAPPIKQSYYHPDMMGSWSLKAVLPTIAPDLDYTALEGVHEGTEASNAYLEAINPETSGERKEELRAQLLKYCEYDTLAMVRLVEFFSVH
jgi:predicted RecB family nuclease